MRASVALLVVASLWIAGEAAAEDDAELRERLPSAHVSHWFDAFDGVHRVYLAGVRLADVDFNIWASWSPRKKRSMVITVGGFSGIGAATFLIDGERFRFENSTSKDGNALYRIDKKFLQRLAKGKFVRVRFEEAGAEPHEDVVSVAQLAWVRALVWHLAADGQW